MPVNKNNTSPYRATPFQTKTVRFIKYWLPVISYAIFIFYLSSIPGEEIPGLFTFQDVIFHIIEYAIFSILVSRALKAYQPGLDYLRRFLWVFFLVIVYAVTDEFHQVFVPHRFPSVIDVIYDGIGVFMGNIFYR